MVIFANEGRVALVLKARDELRSERRSRKDDIVVLWMVDWVERKVLRLVADWLMWWSCCGRGKRKMNVFASRFAVLKFMQAV